MMPTVIYCFSATGNSLHVARILADSLACPVVSMTGLLNGLPTVPAETVGFVFPTHYFGMPPLVGRFISRLDMTQVTYSFAVTTSGSNRFLSATLHQTAELISQKGSRLNAAFHVNMISNYLPLSDLPPAAVTAKKLAKADLQAKHIAALVACREQRQENEPLWLPFAAINTHWKKKLVSQAYRKFSYSPTCVSCGRCATVCPVGNIHLRDGKPAWSDHCQECLACLHACPAQSIEFGSRTEGRKRYHHPAVSVEDIMLLNREQ